jgi:hypothetical protein
MNLLISLVVIIFFNQDSCLQRRKLLGMRFELTVNPNAGVVSADTRSLELLSCYRHA